jgi:hypothetical protein
VSEAGSQTENCSNCGYEFVREHDVQAGPEAGEPCPRCGSTTRTVGVVRVELAGPTPRVHVDLPLYRRVWSGRYQFLLDNAKKLRDQGHYAAAIVTAQTACEVCTETVLTGAMLERFNDDAAVDLITSTLGTYNPNNKSIKNWYEMLFDHRIQDEEFWQSLMEHVNRRHRIVHKGEEATVHQADASIAAVEQYTRHLLESRPEG